MRAIIANKSLYRSRRVQAIVLSATLMLTPRCLGAEPILIAMTDEVRGMCQQAEQLINSRRFSDAERLLNQAQQKDPSSGEVHGYLGMDYQNSGKTQQAISEYIQALQLNPQMSFIKVNLGTCYMNMQQADLAVPLFQQYLQENPNAPDAQQVSSYIQQAGAQHGQQDLRTVVEQGQSYLRQHKSREACQAFQQAISIQPNFAPAHFFLGYALAQSGQYQQAINEFQTSLQIDPSQKEAVLNIGSNYQSMGDCNNAISWYERYLHEFPGSPKAGDIQGRIRGLQQQLSKQNKNSPQNSLQQNYANSPQQNFRNSPSQNFANSTQQNFGNSPSQNFANSTQQNFDNSSAQQLANVPSQSFNNSNSQFGNATSPGSTPDDYYAEAGSDGRYYRWTHMPIRVCIMGGGKINGFRDSYTQAVIDALNKWSAASNNRVIFVPASTAAQADIICDWTAEPNTIIAPGRPIEGGLTKLSGHPQANGTVAISNAHITILTNRDGKPLSDDDMKKVCLHEIGHAIGINGHSNNNADVMFFSEAPTIWPSLTKRDKATICRLYSN